MNVQLGPHRRSRVILQHLVVECHIGFSALTNSVSGPSRLDGIGFAAGLGSACGGGLSELEDCDSAAVAFGGGAEGAGLAFGGGEGYGCGGALYPGLLTLGRGNVGSGTVTQPGT